MFSTFILLLIIVILTIVALCSVLFLKRSNLNTHRNGQTSTSAIANIFDIDANDVNGNKITIERNSKLSSVSKDEVENSSNNNINDDNVNFIPYSKMKYIEKFPESFYKLTNNSQYDNNNNNNYSQDDSQDDGDSSNSSFHIGDYIGPLLTNTHPSNLFFKFDLNNIIENWDMDLNSSSSSNSSE